MRQLLYNKLLLLPLFIILSCTAGSELSDSANKIPVTDKKGRFIPASGDIHVLFVYVQFPDDNWLPGNKSWPKGQPPVYMEDTIDSLWSDNPTPGGFTDFFNQMSFNTLKVTGIERSIITPHSRKWYLTNKKRLGFIHKEVLQQLDQSLDFNDFDRWTGISEYHHINTPDSLVDMIIMMWRNIFSDTSSQAGNALHLKPGGYGFLGRDAKTFTVDEGNLYIKMGYGVGKSGSKGSGVTAIQPTRSNLNSSKLWQNARHEFSHWLLGDNRYHPDLGTFGILSGWGSPGDVINSYERERLGWTTTNTINDITTPRIIKISLPDFVTTSVAWKIKVPGGRENEYFLLENHQRISMFDSPDANYPQAKGLFLLHQKNKYGSGTSIMSAEGKFKWDVVEMIPNKHGSNPSMLPVFKRGLADRVNGYDRRKRIPWSYPGFPGGKMQIGNEYINGKIYHAPPAVYKGTGNDQFTLDFNNVFSPESNPGSHIYPNSTDSIAFEIIDDTNGVYNLNIYINNTVITSPSKPQNLGYTLTNSNHVIHWDHNLEKDISQYQLYRRTGWNGDWKIITNTSDSLYTDEALISNSQDTLFYKVKVMDMDGKWSVFSDQLQVVSD